MGDGRHAEGGFMLIEVLVALVLAMVLAGSLVAMMIPTVQSARAQPEALDLQQRVRAASRTLERDLRAAGAGLAIGPAAGTLRRLLPPLVPRRLGTSSPDASTVVRPDAVTMLWVPVDGVETTLAAPMVGSTATLEPGAGCDGSRPGCGFGEGTTVLIADGVGHFDLFAVTAAVGGEIHLSPRGGTSPFSYAAGATVASVVARTYTFDRSARQLRLSDGAADVTILDEIAGLAIEYFGTPAPALVPKPPAGTANCLYEASGAPIGGSLLTPDDDGLAALPLSILADGPWCGTGATAFDADLLRIRRVRVTVTGQVASSTLRGRGAGFALAGTSRSAWAWVPDLAASFDVAPPNLEVE
ncbi:MAG: hypothetical protein IT184_10975 [Acidobacteria bacterium]|nr:hypothetical protein [Acidobacteriota bacterium]